MASFIIDGDDELVKALTKMMSLDQHRKIVKKHGASLQKKAMRNANFRGHYVGRKDSKNRKFVKPTGATKRSITLEIGNGGLSAKVTAGTDYSGYLEVGTRLMDEQPFMGPAFDEVWDDFVEDLRNG